MRIKTDFVTNSSTSCYIVYIPEGYKVDIPELKRIADLPSSYIELYDENENEIQKEDATDEIWRKYVDAVNDIIKSLQDGNAIDFEELSYDYPAGITGFGHQIINQFILRSEEVGGGGGTIVINIGRDSIDRINEIDQEYANKIGLRNQQL
jgi:hypothetical protein